MTLRVSYSIFLTGIKLYLNFCLFLLLGNKKIVNYALLPLWAQPLVSITSSEDHSRNALCSVRPFFLGAVKLL